AAQPGERAEEAHRVAHGLDHLEADHQVEALAEGAQALEVVGAELEPGRAMPCRRPAHRLRPVDPHHARRHLGEESRAVALARARVEHGAPGGVRAREAVGREVALAVDGEVGVRPREALAREAHDASPSMRATASVAQATSSGSGTPASAAGAARAAPSRSWPEAQAAALR